jgi:uncharacterized protein involved in type VI secretion and phage assembly
MSISELLRGSTGQGKSREHNKVYGVVVGIVRDNKDPLNLGRVKVDFPWLGEAAEAVSISSDEDRAHSSWARIATLMAGPGRGTWFIPEVDDEVLVAFEHGDLDRPFVIGCLWNGDDAPPETMDSGGANNIRSIWTRSGHKIVLDDSDDKPSILIVDKTGENSIFIDSANNAMEVKVKGDLTVEVGGNITVKTDGKLGVQAKQDVSTKTDGSLKLEASMNSTLKAGSSAEIKSDATLKLEGSAQAELKGVMVSVNGSGMTEVKGGLVKIN